MHESDRLTVPREINMSTMITITGFKLLERRIKETRGKNKFLVKMIMFSEHMLYVEHE